MFVMYVEQRLIARIYCGLFLCPYSSYGFTPEMMASIKEWREHGTLADLDCICDRILLNWEGIDDYLDVKATLMLLSSLKRQLKPFLTSETEKP